MEKKICSACNIEKPVSDFYKTNTNASSYRTQCKNCMNTNSKKHKSENKEKIWQKNQEYLKKNREINKMKCAEYRQKNPETFKNWSKKNQQKRKNYLWNYNQVPINKLKNSMRSRLNEFIKKPEQTSRTSEFLGCDYNFLIEYLEKKFVLGMNWENYGVYGWHIDHIIPLSSAKTEEEILKLFHYTNLQPLWAKDNLKKSDKILT